MSTTVVAIGWATGWLAVLVMVADWPPPIGFLWVVAMVATGAVVVWWRAGAYASADGPRRHWGTAARDGALSGVVVGLGILALPGEASRSGVAPLDLAIFFSVLLVVGILNGLAVRALVALAPRRRD